jgi:hypothetical protein
MNATVTIGVDMIFEKFCVEPNPWLRNPKLEMLISYDIFSIKISNLVDPRGYA